MKVVKKIKMKIRPFDRWDINCRNNVFPTGYGVVFEDGSLGIEYTDSNFEYSPHCEVYDDDSPDYIQEPQDIKKFGMERRKQLKIEKVRNGVIGFLFLILGTSLSYKNKERKFFKVVISLFSFFIGLVGIVDSIKYIIKNNPLKNVKDRLEMSLEKINREIELIRLNNISNRNKIRELEREVVRHDMHLITIMSELCRGKTQIQETNLVNEPEAEV